MGTTDMALEKVRGSSVQLTTAQTENAFDEFTPTHASASLHEFPITTTFTTGPAGAKDVHAVESTTTISGRSFDTSTTTPSRSSLLDFSTSGAIDFSATSATTQIRSSPVESTTSQGSFVTSTTSLSRSSSIESWRKDLSSIIESSSHPTWVVAVETTTTSQGGVTTATRLKITTQEGTAGGSSHTESMLTTSESAISLTDATKGDHSITEFTTTRVRLADSTVDTTNGAPKIEQSTTSSATSQLRLVTTTPYTGKTGHLDTMTKMTKVTTLEPHTTPGLRHSKAG
ncbi:probable glycosidase CRH1 [Acanthaster planci]|uniref:Probable glycosidase CRH1 n=1 Tax=Acanthaster planci TaxID=133434 RepID=A0A8B7Y972_ACAPL|nr:probable glycosidase CRH1 [Acanthaster planci]